MNQILHGNSINKLRELTDKSSQCCITSPPYWGLRDYGHVDQIGLETTPEEYVRKLVEIFSEVKRVLRDDGTLWVNIGDSYASISGGYRQPHGNSSILSKKTQSAVIDSKMKIPAGLKPKDLVGIPWMVAFALRADGWYLRSDIIWAKPNPMPESVTDRPTKSHEYIFLLSKSQRYYYDADAIKEQGMGRTDTSEGSKGILGGSGWKSKKADRPNGVNLNCELGYDPKENRMRSHKNMQPDGQTPNSIHERRTEGMVDLSYVVRNKRSVWSVPTMPYKGAHFATFPEDLITPCILAGAPINGIILDPFFGSGTVGACAKRFGRKYIGIELNEKYIKLAEKRIGSVSENLFT